jgi:hypothetical protein
MKVLRLKLGMHWHRLFLCSISLYGICLLILVGPVVPRNYMIVLIHTLEEESDVSYH